MDQRSAPLLATIPPPALYVATFLAGLELNRLAPWETGWSGSTATCGLGWVILATGVATAASSAGLFAFRRTTFNPRGRPSTLVASGTYRFTRNPMYLGLTFAYTGLALVFGKVWPLALLPLPWATMNWIVIPHEEAQLRGAFSHEYADYCRKVRRWI
jgi:protein-S-isoprenylcysteine O-methyltransferase Ste14